MAVISRKFQTPDTAPVQTTTLALIVPDDPAFRAFLTGQIAELTYAENWEQFGALTPAETAEIFEAVLVSWLEKLTC